MPGNQGFCCAIVCHSVPQCVRLCQIVSCGDQCVERTGQASNCPAGDVGIDRRRRAHAGRAAFLRAGPVRHADPGAAQDRSRN